MGPARIVTAQRPAENFFRPSKQFSAMPVGILGEDAIRQMILIESSKLVLRASGPKTVQRPAMIFSSSRTTFVRRGSK